MLILFSGGAMSSDNQNMDYSYNTPAKEGGEGDDDEGTFLSVFEIYDFSFLLVTFMSNFAQGFRRLLELGLYYVFKEKLGM